MNSESKVNTINQVFVLKISLKTRKTNIRAQKIDNIILETYEIIVFTFSLFNKDKSIRIFEYIVLLVNIYLDIILEIVFLMISNANINFEAEDIY